MYNKQYYINNCHITYMPHIILQCMLYLQFDYRMRVLNKFGTLILIHIYIYIYIITYEN